MCSCRITRIPLTGSAKGHGGWIDLSTAAVCFEHTQHACLEEALCIDLFDATIGARIAVELDAASARRLAEAILAVVEREEEVDASGRGPPSTPVSDGPVDAHRHGHAGHEPSDGCQERGGLEGRQVFARFRRP